MTTDGEFRVVYFSQVNDSIGNTVTRTDSEESQEGQAREPIQVGAIDFNKRGDGGVVGVVSQSSETALRVYNGRQKYNEWAFVYMPRSRMLGEGATSRDVVTPRDRNGDTGMFNDR